MNPIVKSILGVVPKYYDLYQRSPTRCELLQIVSHYSLREWIAFISNMQAMVAPPYHEDLDRQVEAFKGLMGPRTQEAIISFEERSNTKNIRLLFEAPLSVLSEITFLYAPREGESFKTAEDFDALADAYFITWDLMNPGRPPTDANDVFARVLQDIARMPTSPSQDVSTRAFYMYQVSRNECSRVALKIKRIFKEATGVDLDDYVFGAFSAVVKASSRDLDDYKRGAIPVAEANQINNAAESACLSSFYELRRASTDDIVQEIRKRESGRPIQDFNVVALSRYPIVDIDGVGGLMVSTPAAIDSIFSGVRHAVITNIVENHHGDERRRLLKAFGGDLGQLFEEYADRILSDAFGAQLWRVPDDTPGESADYILPYRDRVLVIEVKGSYWAGLDHRAAINLDQRFEKLIRLNIKKAVGQIENTIRMLRASELACTRMPNYDWTCTRIVPLIVTIEAIPRVPGLSDFFAPLFQPLTQVAMSELVSSPRLISIEDLDVVPDLALNEDFGQVMLQWAHDLETQDWPLEVHLSHSNIIIDRAYFRERFHSTVKSVCERFGLDARKLRFK